MLLKFCPKCGAVEKRCFTVVPPRNALDGTEQEETAGIEMADYLFTRTPVDMRDEDRWRSSCDCRTDLRPQSSEAEAARRRAAREAAALAGGGEGRVWLRPVASASK